MVVVQQRFQMLPVFIIVLLLVGAVWFLKQTFVIITLSA